MRHLFVTNDFPPKHGGIESYLTGLCRGFPPDDVAVIAPSRPGHEQVDAHLPYSVVRLPGTYLRAKRDVGSRICSAAEDHGADAVHFLHALPLGRLAPSVRTKTGKLTTVVAHGSEVLVPGRAPLVRRVLVRTLSEVDGVLCVSSFTKEAVDELTKGRARTSLLPPSVDVRRFSLERSGARVRERYRLGSRSVVLFVGRLVKRKGADTLVRAMASLPRGVALVVGSGPEEGTLRRLVEELEIESRVVFAGAVRDELLPEFYAAADVFCMPAVSRVAGLDVEGFGIVYLEAAASGLPCVAGAAGGAIEAVVDGETGIVLEEPDPMAVAHALQMLIRDETLRVRMGAAGRARAEAAFAPWVLAAELERQLASTGTATGSS